MKCFNYTQHLDPILDIKRGVGDGGYGDPDYSNIDVVSGNCKIVVNNTLLDIKFKFYCPFPWVFTFVDL
jgi:hypothetical protein